MKRNPKRAKVNYQIYSISNACQVLGLNKRSVYNILNNPHYKNNRYTELVSCFLPENILDDNLGIKVDLLKTKLVFLPPFKKWAKKWFNKT